MRKRAHCSCRASDAATLNQRLIDAVRELLGLRPMMYQTAFDRRSPAVASWVEAPPGRRVVEGGFMLRVVLRSDEAHGRRARDMAFVATVLGRAGTMATKKLPESDPRAMPPPCMDREHRPPSMEVFSPGTWEHTCPTCGQVTVFVVNPAYWQDTWSR